jgi:hypothetical protein
VLEVPVEITGHRRLNYRATTSYFDTGHKTWVQLQRAAEPNLTTFFDFANGLAHVDHNASVPPDDRVGRPAEPETDSRRPPRFENVRGGPRGRVTARVDHLSAYRGAGRFARKLALSTSRADA